MALPGCDLGQGRSAPTAPLIPPLVSVLLPVRDGADHLADAVRSILDQSLSDLELIVVDDGSTDGTPRLLSELSAEDARIRIVRTPGLGIVGALEAARSVATAPFLARMDADDVAMPSRLQAQFELLDASPGIDLCGCGVRYFPAQEVQGGALRYQAWINSLEGPDDIERDLFVECPIAHPTFFARRDALERVGGYQDRGWPEDYDLLLRLWESGSRLGVVGEVLLDWRERPDRLSRVHPSYSQGAFRRCKVEYLKRTLLSARRGAVIWGAGPVGKGFSRALRDVGIDVLAFSEVDPKKLGQEIHGAPVVSAAQALETDGAFHLAAVGQPGAREAIRAVLGAAGLHETRDFVAVA